MWIVRRLIIYCVLNVLVVIDFGIKIGIKILFLDFFFYKIERLCSKVMFCCFYFGFIFFRKLGYKNFVIGNGFLIYVIVFFVIVVLYNWI